MLPDDDRIRRRAYEIWEREGRPEGREAEHWAAAQAELEREQTRSDTQDVPAMRVDQTAPTAAELARRDPSGRARMSEAEERAEQIAAAPEADPLGQVAARGPEAPADQDNAASAAMPAETAPSRPAAKRRSGSAKSRTSRGKKTPDQPPN